jgi:hypothetical protein
MWAYVTAANNGQPIVDAYFSNTYFNDQNGNYYVVMDSGQNGWCDAPNYQTTPFTAPYPANSFLRISLPYIGGWPQTY